MKFLIRRPTWNTQMKIRVLVLALAILVTINVYFALHSKAKYNYREAIATNGVQLHILESTPDQIQLLAINENVVDTKKTGINGGFFYNQDALSIAVQNHVPVMGTPRKYGSGWFNAKYNRGTLVWDGTQKEFSVQSVKSVDELDIFDRDNYWAQGGISMNLADDNIWGLLAYYQALPAKDENRMRSGLVYDDMNRIFMIVSPTLCTASQFRAAIQEQIATDHFKEGIFLDGDGSSQLYTKRISLPGDHRKVVQMIALK
ncbi:hypothetical protein BVG16_01885 [Paenibacillus selenitireducens]|uniref:Phosphodiester glycosidase domain-containing protein n=2 Tax=Paenibacillus selenitireducens TaxID=1324314 RepID=A0A1T2XN46_9BACL|nr:hypothetical protein BVG16_01885 [Paenibacillus selenitireducens]